MQFIDAVTIAIEAGAGGDGIIAWRREKYVPAGGPAGGDGGDGGSVYLVAEANLQTLLDFQFQRLFKAEAGAKGGPKKMTGKSGDDLYVPVPCGTLVQDADSGELLGDLVEAGQTLLVAKGGKGGLGNAHFLSNHNRAPTRITLGKPGDIRNLNLELKLLAEVGIIGLPNAGKSTLISVLSSARPKVADYPFTTLVPNLGVMRKPSGDGLVIADIPGLIEGASQGVGLGATFLRHVERTRVLLHLIDATDPDPIANYQTIQAELAAYSPALAAKPQQVALNKSDAVERDVIVQHQTQLSELIGQPILVISAATQAGCDTLKQTLLQWLESELARP